MEKFTIGGKTFQLIGEGTARLDVYVMRQIAACGINAIAQRDGETDEQYQYRIYMTAVANGDIFNLLGGMLAPEGTEATKWTPEMAKQTAEHIANVTDPEDKKKVRILLASTLMPFFLSGRPLSKTFRRYSPRLQASMPRPTANADTRSTAIGA